MLTVWVVICQRRLDIYNRPLPLKLITGEVLKLLASLALSIVSFPDSPPKVLKGGLGTRLLFPLKSQVIPWHLEFWGLCLITHSKIELGFLPLYFNVQSQV